MIAIESIKKFRNKDYLAIFILSIIYSGIAALINKIDHIQYNYILALFFFILILTLLIHLINKPGTALIFTLLSSILTTNIPNIELTGINKIIVLMLTALVFEIVFIILKLEIKSLPLDIILGASISAALLPLILFIITPLSAQLISNLLNLIILNFLIALAASIISTLVWHELKLTKFILRFEYI